MIGCHQCQKIAVLQYSMSQTMILLKCELLPKCYFIVGLVFHKYRILFSISLIFTAVSDCSWRNTEHNDFVRCAAWSKSDERLYSCSWDGSILRHRVQSMPKTEQPNSVENMETDSGFVNGD